MTTGKTRSSRVVVKRLVDRPLVVTAICMLSVAFAAAFYQVGLQAGASQQSGTLPEDVIADLRGDWEQERALTAAARNRARDELETLSMYVGRMQAEVIRLDAVAERVAEKAQLDVEEFGFGEPVGYGGPEQTTGQPPLELADFVNALDLLVARLDERASKLDALETLLMNQQMAEDARPDGRPVTGGWISSFFGRRTDPYSGRKAMHKGLDFAGKRGTRIGASAPGVVSFSGHKSGYGRMVEVNHGSGYVTRYAHNQVNLAKVGETVAKGDVIALMGSSGRSTGPHVHFEVLRNGKAVNPANYLPEVK